MAGMSVDGLVSGLNTTALISQLMQAEAMPQTLLKQKSSTAQTFVTALQGLNTRIASLTDAATNAAKPASWQAWQATSSTPGATATAGAGAQPGTVTFSVDAVATSRVSITAPVADDGSLLTGEPPSLTILRKSDNTLVTVSPASGSLSDIAKAINDSPDAGVKATVVRVSQEPPTFRMQLTGTTTGSAGGFEVHAGTHTDVADLTPASRIDATTVREAANAQITLWKGVEGLEQTFSQSSNTFTGLMTGVDVTVSKVTAAGEDPTTITVDRDTEALKKLASGLVGALGVVFSEIASKTATTTKTNADGTTSVTGGIFSGDSAIRGISQYLSDAVSRPVDGYSPAEIGIVLGRDGSFTFDEEKFSAALAADPAKVQSMLTQIADRVATTGTSISDKYDGSLTNKIKGQETLVKDYGNQIDSWDRRLDLRRAGLERTYSGLEVMLSKMNSQSSWLAGQLSSLPSWSNS
ncbi:flagellar filament capping protein FliD [Actinotalea sp. K2]|uniref:flagellar filament capping protein FliD n=1 Tax=Actinotalea sp. K2 TaxID=2939438 RepID=UPI0020174884|nr:flagellar filament capping protein FliD [Actinotalea sp. K2]MCL3860850.1 flagellar filament capping protein FliD [Actinotalea sp. K2]